MKNKKKINEVNSDLASILDEHRVLSRLIDRISYANDASFYRLIPQAIVQPNSLDEIRKLFAFSHSRTIPLTFRAAGTSLSGQSITDGVLVDISKHWAGIHIEADGSIVRLGPGIIGGQVNKILHPIHRRIGPDPASIDACMVGGIIANNASGMCCGVVENSYNTLNSLSFMLPNGLFIDTQLPDANNYFVKQAPDIAEGILALKHRIESNSSLRDKIQKKFHSKNTTGYSLNAFIDYSTPLDILSHLIVGSEGTLAFIAQAVLRTLPDYPYKITSILFFPSIYEASSAVKLLRDSGARAIEIMDRAALKSIEHLPGANPEIKELPGQTAGILVEYQSVYKEKFYRYKALIPEICKSLKLIHPPYFTENLIEQANLWKLRKGMFPSIGAMRKLGTTVIIEDVLFPLECLPEAVTDLQTIFARHGYEEAIIFGHAKDGNLHFVITQSFNDLDSTNRYRQFMADIVELVVDKYDGALKAEHGTGRNIAPFVEYEWGHEAYSIMKEIKRLIDPENLLNPGVIINPDPCAHIANTKPLPVMGNLADQCIECGFCESQCPSRNLTTTPRQRIVILREIERLHLTNDQAGIDEILADFPYHVVDTCAVDGLCAPTCPVNINTGDLIKLLRAEALSASSKRVANVIDDNFGLAEGLLQAVIGLGHATEKISNSETIVGITRSVERMTGMHLPKWNSYIPQASKNMIYGERLENAGFVYFPSCLSRVMGKPSFGDASSSLAETLTTIAERANISIWIPRDSKGHCCGMPFESKGYIDAYRNMLSKTINKMWAWSNAGRLPIIIDTSSCSYTLRKGNNDLNEEDKNKWRKLTILDSVEFLHDFVLPRLSINRLIQSVVLHQNCATRKLEIQDKLIKIANSCADKVKVPDNLDCCGFAGDRGLLIPELTKSATACEAAEVLRETYDGYYSNNLTCEMGMSLSTGRPYLSYLYLVEKATK